MKSEEKSLSFPRLIPISSFEIIPRRLQTPESSISEYGNINFHSCRLKQFKIHSIIYLSLNYSNQIKISILLILPVLAFYYVGVYRSDHGRKIEKP